ncbi:50S ribosomal protein L14e [uncultured archaeon]|nr:50S ribosomal protein L14e [uncultured archaeon]
MALLDVGRVVVKTRGRDAGFHGVVISKVEGGRVAVAGPNIREKTVSIHHVEPLPNKVDASDATSAANALKSLGLN